MILSLSLNFGFGKISYSLNKVNQENISESKILKYLPNNNKTFFISNSKSSNITSNIKKNYKKKDQDNLILIKNSIFTYLGIDLGTNKLEDIYDNEIIITTLDNKEKSIDDILIVFKINEKKNIDDILNLSNKVDEPNKLITIFREKKLNYLKYIYRTNDNYILASSNKNLILDALQSSNNSKQEVKNNISLKGVLNNFKKENNILLTRDFEKNKLLNNENYLQTQDDYIATLFDFHEKQVLLKSYLMNHIKNLDITSYQEIMKDRILNQNDYQIVIYNDFLNSIDYFKINKFEEAFLRELNDESKQNILLLISGENWVIVFDKNNSNYISIDDLKILKGFNKYSLENNDFIYKLYSKSILTKDKNIIKEYIYNNIFSAESDKLMFVSNSLINDEQIALASEELLNYQSKIYPQYFLNKKINIKNPYSIQYQNISYLQKINYFFKSNVNISVKQFKAIIKQSIPDVVPSYYAETDLELL